MKLVLVEWEDASGVDDGGGWVSRTALPEAKPVMFQQVGWLLEMTSDHIVMTEAVCEHLIAPRTRIPRGMVRAIYTFDVKAGKRFDLTKGDISTK